MKRSSVLISIFFLLTTHTIQAATLSSLSREQISKNIVGNTVITVPLVTLEGIAISNAFLVYFDKNGVIQGRSVRPPVGGYPQQDEGRWVIKDSGALCISWKHWNNQEEKCSYLFRLSNGLLHVNAKTNAFESVILHETKPGNQINSNI